MVLALIALLCLAILCLLISRKLRRRTGLPRGEILYADASAKNSQVLTSARYRLRGKPDYLLRDPTGGLIPVEIKSGGMPKNGRPHRSHLLQLAVYFLIAEEEFQQEIAYGLIRYKNGEVRIENTSSLREELLAVIGEMREQLGRNEVHRSHQEPRRCAGCSVAEACDERLD